jgi:hypothetical protein
VNKTVIIAVAVAAVLTGVLVAKAVTGSDDGSSSSEVTVPELRPPSGSVQTKPDKGTTADQGATGESTPDNSSSGGAQAPVPDQSSGGTQAPEDTKQKDVPPPRGSPAERFEQFCADNPGAC